MGVDKVEIWNRALGRIAGAPIASENDPGLAASWCRRFYKEVVDNQLEGPHDWSWAKQRVALSSVATNDRDGEWLYGYNLPHNMASPIRMLPDLTSAGLSIPVPLPGQPYAETWATFLDDIAVPYVLDGTTLYTNAENAILEYAVNDLTGLRVSAMVTKAMSIELASLLASSPVKKDKALADKLAQEAELAWQRAIADDLNRQPDHWGGYTSEAMLARDG
jgi:hypothetical protein